MRVLQRAKFGLSESPRIVLGVQVDVGFIHQGIIFDEIHRPGNAAFHENQQTVLAQWHGEIGVRGPAAVVFDNLRRLPLSVLLTSRILPLRLTMETKKKINTRISIARHPETENKNAPERTTKNHNQTSW